MLPPLLVFYDLRRIVGKLSMPAKQMTRVSSSQASLIDEIFVRTADENYITARWCAINQLNTDFLWLGVHALEKYLKAVLLYNGRSAKGYGHDIVRLYKDVKKIAGKLLPKVLAKPANLKFAYWVDCKPEDFLEHLHRNGNADNRYLIYGYATRSDDLHKLDALVFAIRRLICSLDEPQAPLRGLPQAPPPFTYRTLLLRQPELFRPLFMPLDDLISKKTDNPRRAAALNLNMPFAPRNFVHTPMRGGSASRVPVILRRILDPLKRDDPRDAEEGIEAAVWLLANVQVPGDDKKNPGAAAEIKHAVTATRLRLGLPAKKAKRSASCGCHGR